MVVGVSVGSSAVGVSLGATSVDVSLGIGVVDSIVGAGGEDDAERLLHARRLAVYGGDPDVEPLPAEARWR